MMASCPYANLISLRRHDMALWKKTTFPSLKSEARACELRIQVRASDALSLFTKVEPYNTACASLASVVRSDKPATRQALSNPGRADGDPWQLHDGHHRGVAGLHLPATWGIAGLEHSWLGGRQALSPTKMVHQNIRSRTLVPKRIPGLGLGTGVLRLGAYGPLWARCSGSCFWLPSSCSTRGQPARNAELVLRHEAVTTFLHRV